MLAVNHLTGFGGQVLTEAPAFEYNEGGSATSTSSSTIHNFSNVNIGTSPYSDRVVVALITANGSVSACSSVKFNGVEAAGIVSYHEDSTVCSALAYVNLPSNETVSVSATFNGNCYASLKVISMAGTTSIYPSYTTVAHSQATLTFPSNGIGFWVQGYSSGSCGGHANTTTILKDNWYSSHRRTISYTNRNGGTLSQGYDECFGNESVSAASWQKKT